MAYINGTHSCITPFPRTKVRGYHRCSPAGCIAPLSRGEIRGMVWDFEGMEGSGEGCNFAGKILNTMKNTFEGVDFKAVAQRIGVEPAAVRAVAEVETCGRGGFLSGGRAVILFEGHVFWRRLKLYGLNPVDYMLGNEDILHMEWTRRHYRGGIREYERLERAMKIHKQDALESASWGVFQIMGFNYEKCGCEDVHEFVERMGRNLNEQVDLWAEYMRHEGLDECLRRHKWSLFALRYNGKGYKVNRYDERISKAYLKYSKNNL